MKRVPHLSSLFVLTENSYGFSTRGLIDTRITSPSEERVFESSSIVSFLAFGETVTSSEKISFISFSNVRTVPVKQMINNIIPLPIPNQRWMSFINLRRLYFLTFITKNEKAQPKSCLFP